MNPVRASIENFINCAGAIRIFLFFQLGEDEVGAVVDFGISRVIVPASLMSKSLLGTFEWMQ